MSYDIVHTWDPRRANVYTWCGWNATDLRKVRGQASTDPRNVTCPECAAALRTARVPERT